MFTGIIEKIGKVKKIRKRENLWILEISLDEIFKDVKRGDSISVNGVCLTVTNINRDILIFDVIIETLRKTNLKNLKINSTVNLESSIKAGDPLGGHFVYGHIDGIRRVADFKKNKDKNYIDIDIEIDDHNFIAEKGSIAIDGVSLTIGRIFPKRIRIFLIAHTLKTTTISKIKIGDFVNVEFDMLGKFLNKGHKNSRITERFLKKSGF